MIRTLIALSLLVSSLLQVAEASSCNAVDIDTDSTVPRLHTAEASPLAFQFDSGATWELCWHIDPQAGLVISRVFFAAPSEHPRQILDAASIGQILFKYDEDPRETQLLSEYGLGGPQTLLSDGLRCENGELLSGINNQQICQRVRYLNPLTKVRRSQTKPRHEMTLHAWSQIGTHLFQQLWRFSEDGEITPSVIFSGQISRYTSDAGYGIRIDDTNRYASSATLLVNWRLDFNVNGTPANDRVDEIEFRLADTETTARAINISNIENEVMRTTERESFRGWRISDADQPSGDGINRVGYYLDPQGAGYRYLSQNHQWSEFDFFVTRRHPCERHSSGNHLVYKECNDGLDTFVDNESLADADIVVWYSVSRHFIPRLEDYPAIAATELGFALIPFDWSSYSMFSPAVEMFDDRPLAGQ